MKFIDMFCGIGTIRMGFEQAGHECVYSIEWDKWKRRIYEIIFGKEPEGRDIRECSANDLLAADCWCFGAPCQDFSIAGKRAGLEGDRSSLVREVFRLVRETKEEHRPEWLFYENVKGMLSSNKGLDYLEILYQMGKLGYDCEWQLLNSKDFGVPQNRERVFTIGHLRGRGKRKVFPIGESSAGIDKSDGQTSQTCITPTIDTRVGAGTHRSPYILKQIISGSDAQRVYDSNGLARTLKAEGGGQGAKTGLYLVNVANGNMKLKSNNILNCIDANYYKGLDNHQGRIGVLDVRPVLTPNRLNKRQNGRRFKEPNEPMFTLTKQDIHGVEYQGRIRKLTPKECWRLQGISDEITDKVIAAGISDTQMYRAAGDACTVNVIYEIAKRLN